MPGRLLVTMSQKIPLVYTFGNHGHWVDMEWLWGYTVFPSAVQDMDAYCRGSEVKGGVNFDGIGFEKLAGEDPERLALLKQLISEGKAEVIGGSYGQPYGLFQGGESNIRQRLFGIRTAIRLLGTRPRTFWEEEFDFYPQLPQMLRGFGFTGASLYFQWTWHTPEIPFEEAPVIAWQGIDGTTIPTATRNRMNLHQWPEDFKILLDDLAANPPADDSTAPPYAVLQWLELMPTPDWMCRSELMAPMLAELKKDHRFEILAMTLAEYLALWKDQDLPVRQYSMDEVWHGMTLGKNGDNHPKTSAWLEHRILEAETAAAILSLFGRPYKPWDVYPTWELEEAWRHLLAAQHHDNHECEGLCGHVAEAQFAYARTLLEQSDPVEKLWARVGAEEGEGVHFNRFGWPVTEEGLPGEWSAAPAMGWSAYGFSQKERGWRLEGDEAFYAEDGYQVVISLLDGSISQLRTSAGEIEALIPVVFGVFDGEQRAGQAVLGKVSTDGDSLTIELGEDGWASLTYRPLPEAQSLEVTIDASAYCEGTEVDPGYEGAIKVWWRLDLERTVVTADSPYAVHQVGAGVKGRRKYPTGDWMTSPQWFESVEGAFTSQSFVNVAGGEGGLLISHGGSQGWFRTEEGLETVLLTRDPWDEDVWHHRASTQFRLHPHRGISQAECIKRSAGLSDPQHEYSHHFYRQPSGQPEGLPKLPRSFSALTVHNPHVLATAFYREETAFCKRGLEDYAGEGVLHPFVLRLVEADGVGGEVEVTLPGPIAKAALTNLLGETLQDLAIETGDSTLLTSEVEALKPFGIEAAKVRLTMRPYQIATLYLDIVPGRKVFRDLDAKREIWATVHRTEEE